MKNYEIQNMNIINEKIDHSSRCDNWQWALYAARILELGFWKLDCEIAKGGMVGKKLYVDSKNLRFRLWKFNIVDGE